MCLALGEWWPPAFWLTQLGTADHHLNGSQFAADHGYTKTARPILCHSAPFAND
ncbi:Uncharacterised protein [Vibrio cholerae]|nr:Uncharacterised protein [Vibrio cholerae]CSI52432.1 Uncharacterised protein [Vibrio cholerae]